MNSLPKNGELYTTLPSAPSPRREDHDLWPTSRKMWAALTNAAPGSSWLPLESCYCPGSCPGCLALLIGADPI